jgi:hypothetical protein
VFGDKPPKAGRTANQPRWAVFDGSGQPGDRVIQLTRRCDLLKLFEIVAFQITSTIFTAEETIKGRGMRSCFLRRRIEQANRPGRSAPVSAWEGYWNSITGKLHEFFDPTGLGRKL